MFATFIAASGDYILFTYRTFASLRYSLPSIEDIVENILLALRLAWRPTAATSVPFGMAFAFNFDNLLGVIGAQSFAGGAIGPATIRVQGPLIAALVMAAVVGAAFCADLGARKTHDELDAFSVMGVNPMPRLVIPRVIGTAVAMPVMFFFNCAAFILGAYLLLIIFRHNNAGAFIDGFKNLTQVSDIVVSTGKSVLYGAVVGLTACFFGFNAEGGPAGVARNVRSSIIASLTIVFVMEYAITSLLYGGFG